DLRAGRLPGAHMTRIVAGTFKGRRLRTPTGSATRPTSDRVRESLFASLTSIFGGLDDLRVLDLYAGSGAIGLEALSRGAAAVDLLGPDRSAGAAIGANTADLGAPPARVHPVPAQKFVRQPPAAPYDIVFLDPPYDVPTAAVTELVATLADDHWCHPDGLVVV